MSGYQEPINILVVDDEDSVRRRCVRLLNSAGCEVMGVSNSKSALHLVESQSFDLMLVDIRMPGMDGMELLERVKTAFPHIEVLMMTGYSSVDTAIKAMKMGAYDYLTKPFDSDELLHIVGHIADKVTSQREIQDLQRQLAEKTGSPRLIGNSPAVRDINRFIEKVAPVDCNILLHGESGTGKGLVTEIMHAKSPRARGPLVVVDCAALSGSVLESELFGHVKGAFTGAHSNRTGYFEFAQHGTLFLDEIGELPLDLQGKLLRAVQKQEIVRVGSNRPTKVDVRIIAATNRDLEAMVKQGGFRHDLFYRLNVINYHLPALREHPEDVSLLIDHFLKHYAAALKIAEVPAQTAQHLDSLSSYDWPGNVRELENEVQRALIMGGSPKAGDSKASGPDSAQTVSLELDMANGLDYREQMTRVTHHFARQLLEHALAQCQGNISRAAEALGLRRTSLQRLIKRHNLDPSAYKS